MNGFLVVLLDRRRAFAVHPCGLVIGHRDDAVGADREGLVVLHMRGHVPLGLHVQLFVSLLVLETDLVEVRGVAALCASTLDAGLGLVGRQFVRGHVVGVV